MRISVWSLRETILFSIRRCCCCYYVGRDAFGPAVVSSPDPPPQWLYTHMGTHTHTPHFSPKQHSHRRSALAGNETAAAKQTQFAQKKRPSFFPLLFNNQITLHSARCTLSTTLPQKHHDERDEANHCLNLDSRGRQVTPRWPRRRIGHSSRIDTWTRGARRDEEDGDEFFSCLVLSHSRSHSPLAHKHKQNQRRFFYQQIAAATE